MKNNKSANNLAIQDMKMYYNMKIEEYPWILNEIPSSWVIFLYWQIGMWKTTLSQMILTQFLDAWTSITSPTYTYYNVYKNHHYHFDLYRLTDYEQFVQIGWEEIVSNNQHGIILIEWPELIEAVIKPDMSIHIYPWDTLDTRNIKLTTLQYPS